LTYRQLADPNPDRGLTVGFGMGPANCLTDIGGRKATSRPSFLDLQLSQTRYTADIFGRYKMNDWLSLNTALYYGRIAGADSISGANPRGTRNYSFTNNIFELSLRPEIYFPTITISRTNKGTTLFDYYVTTGASVFRHSPKLTNNNPGTAEPEKVKIIKYQPAIPFGVGCYFSFPRRYKIGFETGWRYTFTDYLDGFTRPSSKGKDSYIFSTITLSYTLYENRRPAVHKFKKNTHKYRSPAKKKSGASVFYGKKISTR